MKPHDINTLGNFIAGWYLDDTSICDELIRYHKNSPDKRPGVMQGADGAKVDTEEKDSMDVALASMDLARKYIEGGGTEFLYQKLTIQPEKGLTLIWPSEWMFTHRGVVSETQEKYIITGWFSTYTKEQYERLRQRFGG